eukprot:1195355-Prorocentrum_minimum.AAC.2
MVDSTVFVSSPTVGFPVSDWSVKRIYLCFLHLIGRFYSVRVEPQPTREQDQRCELESSEAKTQQSKPSRVYQLGLQTEATGWYHRGYGSRVPIE